MDRFFRRSKTLPCTVKQISDPLYSQTVLDIRKKIEQQRATESSLKDQLDKVQKELKYYHSEFKKTKIDSESKYLKKRLRQKLLKRKHLNSQLKQLTRKMRSYKQIHNKLGNIAMLSNSTKSFNFLKKKENLGLKFPTISTFIDETEDLDWKKARLDRLINQDYDISLTEDFNEKVEQLELLLEQTLSCQETLQNSTFYTAFKKD